MTTLQAPAVEPEANLVPTPDDRFASGSGRSATSGATRSRRQPGPRSTHSKPSSAPGALGAYGVSLRDDDLVPPGSSSSERDEIVRRFRRAVGNRGSGNVRLAQLDLELVLGIR